MTNINNGVLDGVRRIGAAVRSLSITGGISGAPLGMRLMGANVSGPPQTGTWKAGDIVSDRAGSVWVCTTGGTGAGAAWRLANAGAYATQVLASAAASITFSAIPAGYSLLRLLVIGASSKAAESDQWAITVNGDTGNHYDCQFGYFQSTGITAANAGVSGIAAWKVGQTDVPAASATAGIAGLLEIEIPAYAGTTFQKTGKWRSGYNDAVTNVVDQACTMANVTWRSTAAITSVTIALAGGANLIAGTTALLYLS